MTYDIGAIRGDGIGPEVIDATLPLIGDLAYRHGFSVRTTGYD